MTRRRLVGFLLAIALLATIEFVAPFRNAVSSAFSFLNPVEGFAYRQTEGVRGWFVRLLDGDRSQEIDTLRAQVVSLGTDHTQLVSLQTENEKLKKLLRLQEDSGWQTVSTRVIGRDPRDPIGLVRLGAGAQSGVRNGAAVVDPDGFFVAKIVSVGQTTSIAQLLQSQQLTVSARVLGREDMIGLLESPDGISLRVKELPKSGDLAIGDIIATSSEDGGIIPNLPIASILSIVGKPEDLWREAMAAPLSSPKTIDFVTIIVAANASE